MVGRRRLVGVVSEASRGSVEDEPAPTPGADAAAHLDEEAGGAVGGDGEVRRAVDQVVAGGLDELAEVERRAAAHRQVPRQRSRLRPHTAHDQARI